MVHINSNEQLDKNAAFLYRYSERFDSSLAIKILIDYQIITGTIKLLPPNWIIERFKFFDIISDMNFVACAQIRLVVEEGLNQLPYQKHTVITPTGQAANGNMATGIKNSDWQVIIAKSIAVHLRDASIDLLLSVDDLN